MACSARASLRAELLNIRHGNGVHAFAGQATTDAGAKLHAGRASKVASCPQGTAVTGLLDHHQLMATPVPIASTRRVVICGLVAVKVAVMHELDRVYARGSRSLRQPSLYRVVALLIIAAAS